MKKGMLVLAAAAVMAFAPMNASAAIRGFYGAGFYGAGFYGGGPYWGAPYGGYYYANAYSGEVKLDTKVKDADVFINGAYAGTTHQNKSMHLRQGNYNLEIKEAGRTQFSEKIYVIAGKTLHLHPEL